MDALKKFIQKKKTDSNFKKAGPGHKLSDSTGASCSVGKKSPAAPSVTPQKKSPGLTQAQQEQKRQAAAAALARQEKSKPTTEADDLRAKRQIAFIKEQARKEIEAEKQLKQIGITEDKDQSEKVIEIDQSDFTLKGNVDPSLLAVSGVYFSCPLIGPEIASKTEIEANIREFLHSQPSEELGVTSCLLIYSCNKGKEKIQSCVNILCKYVDNIIQGPGELKYRKIRCSNKAYLERVAPIEGSQEFLEAAGFKRAKQVAEDSQEEDVWEFTTTEEETEFVARLTELRDSLLSTTPIKPELDRNLQVLLPAQATQRRELPSEFYELTAEELKREQQRRSESLEKEQTLRTKAQRERDEMREQRLYRYAVMRVRFPDGFTLQGTFHSQEKVGDLYVYVQENLGFENIEFSLKKPGGEKLSNMDQTLAEAKLPPATIVNFNLESDLPSSSEINFLKPEILALVQNV